MQIKARKCFVPPSPSRWVAKVYLTCDNMIAVEYRHGQHVKKILPHGPGAYLGTGGVPSVCCLYPGTQGQLAENLYHLAEIWSYGGEWVHAFLYKKFGYMRVSPPASCGYCHTSCSIQVSPTNPTDGQAVTITVRVTNTDGGSKGDAPAGTVTISVDGTEICSKTLPPEDEPDDKNWAEASCSWTATCVGGSSHSIEVVYAPSEADFASTSCSGSVTVSCVSGCCEDMPATLHATISNVRASGGGTCTGLAGTYPLTYDSGLGLWAYSSSSLSIQLETTCEITVACLIGGVVSGQAYSGPQGVQCSPLELAYSDLLFSPTATCCPSGLCDVTVTT